MISKTFHFALYGVLSFTCCGYADITASGSNPQEASIATVTLEVAAGQHDRQPGVVSFPLPKKWHKIKTFQLLHAGGKQPIAVQRDNSPQPRLLWILKKPLKAGQTRRYHLHLGAKSARHSLVNIAEDENGLTVRIGNRPVLRYNTATLPCPIANSAACKRSGFIHPVYNPAGQVVTDDFPPDHPHQHGIMFPWTNTTFEKRNVDFWNQNGKTGTVEHMSLLSKQIGPVFAEFQTQLRHVDLSAPGGRKSALKEIWTVRVYHFSKHYIVDLESVQTCAGKSTLRINKYHYGAMAIRGARPWFQKGACDFLTSDGKTRRNGNHTRPRWVDMHGTIDGTKSGIAMMCHPKNFRANQPVRLHPSKPYFCWAPQILGGFSIVSGQEYVSKYRCVVHQGKPNRQVLERVWRDYTQPMAARIVE